MDAQEWNESIKHLPGSHILQTWEWGQVKADIYGWVCHPRLWKDENGNVIAAALILQRSAPLRIFGKFLKILYIPRGPLLDWGDENLRKTVLDDLQELARQKKAIFIKMDPELITGSGVPGSESAQEDGIGLSALKNLIARGWQFSDSQIQFKNTVWIDLTKEEEELLNGFKQKTRYNVRLAGRKGVSVRNGGVNDLPLLYKMYLETASRDGFIIRSESYYLHLWKTFIEAGQAEVLIADVNGEAVSAMLLFHFAGKAWFLFGMSVEKHRQLMPTYLMQWEAMKLARKLGCKLYDMWGAPDVFDESDSMWGVYRFKEGFQGEVIRTCGAWDYFPNKILYWGYSKVLPKIIKMMQKHRRKEINQGLD